MYISIDMERCRFLHKYPIFTVVTDLVFIEAPDNHVDIEPVDYGGLLRDATPTELAKLYRNTTGQEPVPGDLRPLLRKLVLDLPVTDVNAWEVQVQANYVERLRERENGVTGLVYVKGSSRPAKLNDGLFQPEGLRGTIDPSSFAAPAPTQGPATPRTGSVRDTIWKVADQYWEANGKPTDKPSVLELRKRIMDVLEREHGVKRTSSSNELGNWAKARI